MSDVIALNDSNDSSNSEEVFGAERDKGSKRRNSSENSVSSGDFNFPSVHFSCVDDVEANVKRASSQSYDRVRDFPGCSPVHEISSSYEEDSPQIPPSQHRLDVPAISYTNNLKEKCRSRVHSVSDSSDSDANHERIRPTTLSTSPEVNKKLQKPKASKAKSEKDADKEKLKEQRLLKKQNLLREKALKAINARHLKNMKPGECLNYMEVLFDESLKSFDFYNETITMLNSSEIKHSTPLFAIPDSITWKRNIEHYFLTDDDEIGFTIRPEILDQMILVWNWEKVVNTIADGTFSTVISSIKDLVPNYNITLVIYNINKYFASFEKPKQKSKADTRHKGSNENFKNFPTISSEQLESCLTEIQVYNKCNSRIVDSVEDMALLVYQYTKAAAEFPYKREQNKSLECDYNWYVSGDKRATVKVDKEGHGMKKLWQQQLCQFNLASLEVADAICSKYSSPVALMEAYMSCTRKEGENLLKDVPIRRAAGPLTTCRKIGPELSRKIYIMFTAENPNTPLA